MHVRGAGAGATHQTAQPRCLIRRAGLPTREIEGIEGKDQGGDFLSLLPSLHIMDRRNQRGIERRKRGDRTQREAPDQREIEIKGKGERDRRERGAEAGGALDQTVGRRAVCCSA